MKMLHLPIEMTENIFLHLTLQSMMNMKSVSKTHFTVGTKDYIWKHHFNLKYKMKDKLGQYEMLYKKYYNESNKLTPKQALRWGIKHKCTPFVINILQNNAFDILNYLPEDRYIPIYAAAIRGLTEVVQLFISSGFSKPDDTCVEDSTPLYVACQENHLETVKCLVKHGANIEFSYREGFTPLYVACQRGNLDISKYLMDIGANINAQCVNGSTPLYIASQEGHDEVVKLLLKHGANKNTIFRRGYTPLYVACRNGHVKVAKILVEDGVNINVVDNDGGTPLYTASQEGRHEVVKLLLGSGADPQILFNGGYTPLYVASQNGHDKVVCALLQSPKTRLNYIAPNGASSLYIACQNGNLTSAKMLLEHGANCNIDISNGCSPLYISSHKGYEDIVALLLDYHVDVNYHNMTYNTALYDACCNGHLNIVKLLISRDATVFDYFEGVIKNGNILHKIINSSHYDVILFLLKTAPYLLYEKNNDNISPLQLVYELKSTYTINFIETYLKGKLD